MKKYAPVMICVLFVMLASVLRHVVLPQAKSAAAEYGRRAAIHAADWIEDESALHFNG